MQSSSELEVPSVAPCASDQAVWPWQAEPYRLWSLLEMVERFPLSKFGAYLADFERGMAGLEVVWRPPQSDDDRQTFLREAIQYFQSRLTGIVNAYREGNVPISYPVQMQIDDFLARSSSRFLPSEVPALVEHARLTRQAVLNDLAGHLFLHVDADSAKFYVNPLNGWKLLLRDSAVRSISKRAESVSRSAVTRPPCFI